MRLSWSATAQADTELGGLPIDTAAAGRAVGVGLPPDGSRPEEDRERCCTSGPEYFSGRTKTFLLFFFKLYTTPEKLTIRAHSSL
jgi:hypothetical protein